jgi:VWFA-related protein
MPFTSQRRPPPFLLGVAGVLLWATTQALGADQKKPLVFGSDVSLVQVPVFVSGRDGGAARGLKASDFRVEEDGKPVEVVSFRYVDTTSAEQQESIRSSSAARRRFLLLFDKSFTDPFGLARARDYASKFVLNDLAASDLVGVATFDFLHGIKLVANFTEDRRVVEHAIYTLGVTSLSKISDPLAIAADFSSTDLTRERGTTGESETPAALISDVIAALAVRARSAEEQSYKAKVLTLLDSFEQLGASLRRIDGRKQVVYFSTGFNSTMLVGQDQAEQTRASEAIVSGRLWEVDSDSRYGDTRMRAVVQNALQHLSRADAVVHSIDLGGLGYKEEYNQTASTTGMPTRDAGGRESLATIAAETGGRFYKDANNLGPVLREMADMTSRYYVLGVQPRENRPDGGFRKLRVRVGRPGLRVSHRPGFFEKSTELASTPAPVLQRQFEAAELIVSGGASLAVGAKVLDFKTLLVPVPTDVPLQRLGVVLQVPKDSLPEADGVVEVYGYALSGEGTVVDHFAHFLRTNASRAGAEVLGISFSGQFALLPGVYTLRLLVQRPATGEMGLRHFDVTVPKREAMRGFLLPPMFIEDRTRWVEVALRNGSAKTEENPASRPSLPFDLDLEGASFLPRTESVITPGKRERLVLVAYEPERAKDPAADIDIRAVLSDAEGKSHAPGLITVEKVHHAPDGRRTYILAFMPAAGLTPGDYTLGIRVGEGPAVLRSFCRLKVLPSTVAANR